MSERAPALAALEKLLIELFSPDELRRWVAHNQFAETHDLLGDGASPAALAHGLVCLLERHKQIDQAFFAALVKERPRRADEIDRVGVLYSSLAAGPSRSAASPSRPVAEVWHTRFKRSRALLAAFSAIWLITRAYPTLDVCQALLKAERALFSFLPLPHQRTGLLALIAFLTLCTLLFAALARRGIDRRF